MLVFFKSAFDENFFYPVISGDPKIIFENLEESICIKTMSLNELVEIRANWLVPEGWSGIKYTLAAAYANDREGFFILEKNQQKIASISVVTYPEINFAYIGFYLVVKNLRGQGYGKLLITKAIEHAKEILGITSFGLNCVEDAVSMYQKYGFQVATVDEFWKYTAGITVNSKTNTSDQEYSNLDKIDDQLFSELTRFDASVLGAHRTEFLRNFVLKPNTITVISQDSGKINGYGVISEREPAVIEANKSYKLGPLYADNGFIADAILEQLVAIAKPGESVYLETPGNNPVAASVVKALGFEKIGVQSKMFKGEEPNFDIKRIFAYSSIAIGG